MHLTLWYAEHITIVRRIYTEISMCGEHIMLNAHANFGVYSSKQNMYVENSVTYINLFTKENFQFFKTFSVSNTIFVCKCSRKWCIPCHMVVEDGDVFDCFSHIRSLDCDSWRYAFVLRSTVWYAIFLSLLFLCEGNLAKLVTIVIFINLL